MPVDLSPLLAPLTPSGVPDLDASDERLIELDVLASKDRHEAAAAKVAALLSEGIFDVRPLPYLLFQAFVERGFGALPDVLGVIDNLLGPSLPALAPSRRRDELANKRFAWLFDKIEKALEYHEKVGTPEWDRWRASLSDRSVEAIDAAGARVTERLAPAAFAPAGAALGRLLARVRAQLGTVHDKPSAEAPPAPAAAAPPASSPASPASPAAEQPSSPEARPPAEPPTKNGMRRMELLVAQPFLDFCRRLDAFAALVQRGQFEKAAVLADEIGRSIESFDPRAHFPDLFARYAALQSKHVRALLEHGDERESPAFRALQQHARVDLDGFVEG